MACCCGCASGACVCPSPLPMPLAFLRSSYEGRENPHEFVLRVTSNFEERKVEGPEEGVEGWISKYTGLMKSSEEPFTAQQFLAKLKEYFCQAGFRKLVKVSIDGKEIYRYNEGNVLDDLGEGIEKALKSTTYDTLEIEAAAVSRDQRFYYVSAVDYTARHPDTLPSLTLVTTAVPDEVVRREGEGREEFRTRTEAFERSIEGDGLDRFLQSSKSWLVSSFKNDMSLLDRAFYVQDVRATLISDDSINDLWTYPGKADRRRRH